jgi:anti-anti-sigma regulatory factor
MKFEIQDRSSLVIMLTGSLADHSLEAKRLVLEVVDAKVNYLNILLDCAEVTDIGKSALRVIETVNQVSKRQANRTNFGDRIVLVAASDSVQRAVTAHGLNLKNYPSVDDAMRDIEAFHTKREQGWS